MKEGFYWARLKDGGIWTVVEVVPAHISFPQYVCFLGTDEDTPIESALIAYEFGPEILPPNE